MHAPTHLLLMAALLAANAHGDVATSPDYSITRSVSAAGGGRVRGGPYVANVIITPVAGRQVAQALYTMNLGFVAQLNNPPLATDDLRSRPADSAVDILNAALLGNDIDQDADHLSILSVDQTTPAGGSVLLSQTSLRYSPPAGFIGVDTFRYTAVDVSGDTSTATVTLVVAPPANTQPLNTLSMTRQADGSILLRFRQQAGRTEYHIQRAIDLVEQDWETLVIARAGADGIVEVLLDPGEADESYFRALVF